MLRRTLLASVVATPVLASCAGTAQNLVPAVDPMAPLPEDNSSHAQPAVARVTHVSLDLEADFERKVMTGKCKLRIATAPGAREIVLDNDNLVIRSIKANGRDLQYAVGERRPTLGAPLTVQLDGADEIEIDYESSPGASALQFLEPAQTASNKKFLFSQGQAILNRSWIPTQDSPGIRQTYDARIVGPADLKVVMSAEMLTPDGEAAGEGKRAFRFRMPQRIPPYLIAIAIGDLVHHSVTDRTGVWCEPSVRERAAYECADMGNMMRVAEALYGEYRWGRYDVLILPPSFPYGGMENPRLTFLTPTFLAGDRSLVSLIAHELAHSWSGNLVTNAVWGDSWLNEGFTSYIEDRIGEELFGVEETRMAEVLSWAALQHTLQTAQPAMTVLHQDPAPGADGPPSTIVYDKGAWMLRTIERIIGRSQIDTYLRGYFDRHAFGPMTSEWFLADFRQHIVRGDAALEAQLMLDQWVYQPGLPSNAQEPVASGFAEVDQAVQAFTNGGAPAVAWANWNTAQRQRYLQTLPRELSRARLDALQAALRLNETGNSEVLFDWLALAVRNRYQPAVPALETFLTGQGRGKFVRPLYTALMGQGDWGQPIARRIYARARAGYHPIVQAGVDRIVTPA
jgi:leukotriene-A4 hydrolase